MRTYKRDLAELTLFTLKDNIMKYIFAILLLCSSAVAQEKLVDFTEEGSSNSVDSVQARQDAIQEAVERVSGRLIREIIGDSKFDRNLTSIKSKVITQYDKYIPFIKTGEARVVGEQIKTSVQMKVSLESLEALLKKSGFMSAQEGPAILLPVVGYYDLINNRSMKWWVDNPAELNPFLKSQDRAFNEALKTQFSKQGFHVQDPQSWHYRRQVPESLQLDSPRSQDYIALAENFKSQIVLRGEVKVDQGRTTQNYKVTAKLVVLGSNGRVIADSLRSAETEAGTFHSVVQKKMADVFEDIAQDLAAQVQEAYSRGTLGATLIRLVVSGNFNYKDVEQIKNEVRQKIKPVRTLTERLFVKGVVEFDVDVAGGMEALSQSFQKAVIRGAPVKVSQDGTDRLEVWW